MGLWRETLSKNIENYAEYKITRNSSTDNSTKRFLWRDKFSSKKKLHGIKTMCGTIFTGIPVCCMSLPCGNWTAKFQTWRHRAAISDVINQSTTYEHAGHIITHPRPTKKNESSDVEDDNKNEKRNKKKPGPSCI